MGHLTGFKKTKYHSMSQIRQKRNRSKKAGHHSVRHTSYQFPVTHPSTQSLVEIGISVMLERNQVCASVAFWFDTGMYPLLAR